MLFIRFGAPLGRALSGALFLLIFGAFLPLFTAFLLFFRTYPHFASLLFYTFYTFCHVFEFCTFLLIPNRHNDRIFLSYIVGNILNCFLHILLTYMVDM